jgi:hypothetical protein
LIDCMSSNDFAVHFGGYSMDVTAKGAGKSAAMDDCISHFKPAGRSKTLYFGGEFCFFYDDGIGRILKGIDMEVLETNDLSSVSCAIALSRDQDTIPDHEKIVAGGSGTGSLIEWLKALNEQFSQ